MRRRGTRLRVAAERMVCAAAGLDPEAAAPAADLLAVPGAACRPPATADSAAFQVRIVAAEYPAEPCRADPLPAATCLIVPSRAASRPAAATVRPAVAAAEASRPAAVGHPLAGIAAAGHPLAGTADRANRRPRAVAALAARRAVAPTDSSPAAVVAANLPAAAGHPLAGTADRANRRPRAVAALVARRAVAPTDWPAAAEPVVGRASRLAQAAGGPAAESPVAAYRAVAARRAVAAGHPLAGSLGRAIRLAAAQSRQPRGISPPPAVRIADN